MDKDSRVLSNLIENLEDIKGKLASIDYDREWINCFLPNRESRSYINVRHVLESLVTKTVEGKGYDEDIASICNQHKPFLEQHLQLQNLFSSEEYLKEATNLPKMPLKFEFLHSSLMTFQDFLGDILHSICQISSCQLKLHSKILVKDLLKLKNQYLSIWDLIYSVFGENKCHKGSDSSFMGESNTVRSKVGEIQKCLQMSLKEMSIVKLEIEHYFKCNLIEMQFIKPPYDADKTESVNSKEEVFECSTESEYSLLKNVNSLSQEIMLNKNTCNLSSRKKVNTEAHSSPSLKLTEAKSYKTESKENNNNSRNSFQSTSPWNDIFNSSGENRCEDFFYKPENPVFPSKFLFVDPTTNHTQSKKDDQRRNALPKVYIEDSFNENISKKPNMSKKVVYQKHNEFDIRVENNVKVEKVEEIPITKSMTEEDLFGEKKDKNENQTYSICLQEKMSSLLNMLRSSEAILGEDIFEEMPLKIENNEFSSSRTDQNFNLKCNNNNLVDNVSSSEKFNDTPKNHCDSSYYKNKIPSGEKHEKISIDKNKDNYEIPFYFGGLKEKYHNDKSMLQEEKVIYDQRSLIELFHSKEADQGLNTGSTLRELSTFSLWPVTAEYIHVSKRKGPQKCQSVSSDNSIPLSKSFEKSYYSLHLNKRYEQKQFYDGDLIVLDSPERIVHQASSSYTFLNQPYSFFRQKENYKQHENINYAQHTLDGKFNNQMQLPQNTYQLSSFKKGKDCNNKRKTLQDVKKTLAVCYKDCGDSFKATDKTFHRENYDFLKVNGFDNNKNWNSFISIFTSKVGPTAQINHHRMFRKVINTFATDSITCNNVYGNVHTLTSNGGPFRLFDINGYPLTDSTGNVLKDPYGKSVVTLDSTGFPKDDMKVFDAAGNSFNDINFDPTQKPKTNSIIIKLTDNFKRPLHLFDKYGRPLTDSCGKLLVNIHGRPLLRFDNFGRPNTDYRGGPLYTDNGYRWSHKTDDSLSSNMASNESLMPKTLCEFHESESRQNFCENFSLQDKKDDKSILENVDPKPTVDRKFPILNPSESDIWIKLENILQTFPKNKKIEPKASQTSVIINNVTITQNPIEKEYLNSIIYHNNIIQQDVNHFNRIHSQPLTNHKTFIDFQNIYSCMGSKRMEEKRGTYYVGKQLHTDENKPYHAIPFLLQKGIYEQNACSKCLNFNPPKHVYSNKYLNEPSFNIGKSLTCDTGDIMKNTIATNLTPYSNNSIKNKSYLSLKNHDYLNSLCNRIIKHEMKYLDSNKHHIDNGIFKKNREWTDTSNTEFLSSIESKYTTGFTTQTESPVYFSDTSKNQSQDTKVQNKYYNSYIEKKIPFNYYRKEIDVLNEDKSSDEFYHVKSEKDYDCVRQKDKYISNEQAKEQFHNKGTLSLQKSKNDKMSIQVLNKGNKHYEIKVTEMLSKIINPKINFGVFSTGKTIKEKTNSFHTTSKKEIESSSKTTSENSKNELVENNCSTTENYPEKINNSLFRFYSDEILKPTLKSERKPKASYSRKIIHSSYSNMCKDNFKVHHEDNNYLMDKANETFAHDKIYKSEIKHGGQPIKPLVQLEKSKEPPFRKKDRVKKSDYVNRKSSHPVRKPASSNRECNLASFFGSPVRYVLNKIDGKRSFKPNKPHTSVKNNTLSNSSENFKKSYDTTNLQDKTKPTDDIKTLYDISKSSKKSMLSSSEKAERKTHRDMLIVNEQDTLLAFPSKSGTGLLRQDKDVPMCYSGDSQSVNRKKLSHGFRLSRNKLQKSVSATSYITVERSKRKDSMRQSTKYEQDKEIHKNGQNSLKHNVTRGNYTKRDSNTQKSSKSRKASSGGRSKLPLMSSRTRAKEISLFKKVEPEGKYMLKIKR